MPAFKATSDVLGKLRCLQGARTISDVDSGSQIDAAMSFEAQASNFQYRLDALSHRLGILLKERESTAHLLEQTISARNQQMAQRQTELVTKLTKSTVDDSVNVRIITVITLVYLSAAVVAVRICSLRLRLMAETLISIRPLWTCHSFKSTPTAVCRSPRTSGYMWPLRSR